MTFHMCRRPLMTVAGAVFGEVGGSFCVAGAVFGEVGG